MADEPEVISCRACGGDGEQVTYDGDGKEHVNTCGRCGGTGLVVVGNTPDKTQTCPTCGGSGKTYNRTCKTCGGTGTIKKL